MVVVPMPVRERAMTHPLLQGLLVTDAGYFPNARNHQVERPTGAPTDLLILCLKGEGWVRTGMRTTSVGAGTLVWLPAGQPHAYGAAPDQPWTIVWAHFLGREVEEWQRELGMRKDGVQFFDVGTRRPGMLGIDKVYAVLELGYSPRQLLSAAIALRTVFGEILELVASSGAVKTAAERTAAVRESIIATPERAYRLGELAHAAGLSVPHFCALFRRQTGYAPVDFLIRQRVRRACRLLDTTEETIAVVATQAGFEDPYYFSRCFRRVMGVSPRAYRQRIRG